MQWLKRNLDACGVLIKNHTLGFLTAIHSPRMILNTSLSAQFTRLLTHKLCLLSCRNCRWICRNSPVWPANHCVQTRSCEPAPRLCPRPAGQPVQVPPEPGGQGGGMCTRVPVEGSKNRWLPGVVKEEAVFWNWLLLVSETQDWKGRDNHDHDDDVDDDNNIKIFVEHLFYTRHGAELFNCKVTFTLHDNCVT